jgi:hypothetical protein
MIKNRFFKTTQGFTFELLVAKTAPDGTDGQSLEQFVSTATVYDIAAFVFDKAVGKPVRKALTGALSAADKAKQVFFAVEDKTNSVISTTPIFGTNLTAEKIAYKAPTNQVTTLSHVAGTISTLQELSIKIVETTPGTSKLPTWDYTSQLTLGAASTYTKLVNTINAAKEDEFFTASLNAFVAPVFGTATYNSGGIATIPVTSGGSGIVTSAIPSGTGTLPLTLTGNGTGGVAVANIVDGVVKNVSITTAGSGYSSLSVSLSSVTVLPGITVTSTDPTRHFRVVAIVLPTKGDNADYGVTFNTITPIKANAGSGTLDHILELQKEANVLRGIGHYYPKEGFTAADFGLPEDIVTKSGTTTWDLVVIRGTKTEKSPTPLEQHTHFTTQIIALPSGSLANKIVALFA